MVSSGFSVGTVSVLTRVLGILALFAITFLAKRCLRLSTMLHLRAHGSAPIAYDTFMSPLGAFNALKSLWNKFSLSRAIMVFLIILCIPSELALDFGVDVSEKCRPIRLRTQGLCAAPLKPKIDAGSIITIIQHTTEWDDKLLIENPIYQGFRQDIKGNEYFGPDKRRNLLLPVVVKGCIVSPRRILRGNVAITLYFGGQLIDGGYVFVPNLRIDNITVASFGLLQVNAEKPVLVALNSSSAPSTGFKATLFEYHDWRHLRKELTKLNTRKPVITFVAKSRMVSTTLGCESTGLDSEHINGLLLPASRISILEQESVESLFIDGDQQVAAFQEMTKAELVRAVLGFKVCYQQNCEGETFEYTHCAYYNIYYAIPMLSIFGTFLIWLMGLEARNWYVGRMTEIPMSAKEWYQFFHNSRFDSAEVIKQPSLDQNVTGKLTRRGRSELVKYEFAKGKPVTIVRD